MTQPVTDAPNLELGEYIWNVSSTLLNCLCGKLSETVAGVPCRCLLLPGEIAILDTCGKTCDGEGQAWIRLVQTYLSQRFPSPIDQVQGGSSSGCLVGMHVAELELGVTRCAAPMKDNKTPAAAALQSDTAKVWDDMSALWYTVQCCIPRSIPNVMSSWTPISGGGCTGGKINVLLQIVPGPIGARNGTP